MSSCRNLCLVKSRKASKHRMYWHTAKRPSPQVGRGTEAHQAGDWRVSQRNEQSQICLGKKPIYEGEKAVCKVEGGTHTPSPRAPDSSEPWCFQKSPADIGGLR